MRTSVRHLFICTLLFILPVAGLAQTTRATRDWADRLTATDSKVRASAATDLVRGGQRSLPMLRRLLDIDNEDLRLKTFDVIRRLGPTAIPLMVELLRDERVAIRRTAVDVLIDLPPYTQSIQPALRRALRDDDAEVAGDAARAGRVGRQGHAFGPRARQDALARRPVCPRLRGRSPRLYRTDRERSDPGSRQGRKRPDARRPMGGV